MRTLMGGGSWQAVYDPAGEWARRRLLEGAAAGRRASMEEEAHGRHHRFDRGAAASAAHVLRGYPERPAAAGHAPQPARGARLLDRVRRGGAAVRDREV